MGASLTTVSFTPAGSFEQLPNGGREFLSYARSEQTGNPMDNRLAYASFGDANHGRAAGHRLQRHEAERFLDGCVDHQGGFVVTSGGRASAGRQLRLSMRKSNALRGCSAPTVRTYFWRSTVGSGAKTATSTP
jgi:hypothetical protein